MKKILLISLCVPLMFSNCTNQDQELQNDAIGTNVFDYGYEKTKIIRTLRNDNNKIIELVKETEIDGKQMRITEEYNNDVYIKSLQKKDKWYSINPIHITQKDGWSDNFNEIRNLSNIIKHIPTE